ncbi:MAG: hypothetical protein WB626_11350 [Bacteroidota bacterium]
MATKPAPPVKPAPGDALERAAYAAVEDIPLADPHERDRLGYSVWRCLRFRVDGLEAAVRSAGVRPHIPEEEAVRRIREALARAGHRV